MSKKYLLCLALSLLLFTGFIFAQNYTVKQGDSLISIAKKNNLSVKELKDINKLNNDNIRIGQVLNVTKPVPLTPVKYKVKKGDSLSLIANKNKTTIEQIKEWNKLKNNTIIEGQTIIVGYAKNENKSNNNNKNNNNNNNNNSSNNNNSNSNDKVHVVKKGENLTTIAKKYNLNVIDLIEFNNLKNFIIQPGQKLALKENNTGYNASNNKTNTIKHTVKKGENLFRIALHYGCSVDDIRIWNSLSSIDIYVGQSLSINNTQKNSASITSLAPTVQPSFSHLTLNASSPVPNNRVISEFGIRNGVMHKGIDFSEPANASIYAVLKGTVVFSGTQKGYGNVIIIEHDNDIMTVYAHNNKNLVKVGQFVSQGQTIAHVGKTGNAEGNHLHFEYRYKGVAKNPRELLNLSGVRIASK